MEFYVSVIQGGGFASYKTTNFYIKEPVPSQEYGSCFPFFFLAFDYAI